MICRVSLENVKHIVKNQNIIKTQTHHSLLLNPGKSHGEHNTSTVIQKYFLLLISIMKAENQDKVESISQDKHSKYSNLSNLQPYIINAAAP